MSKGVSYIALSFAIIFIVSALFAISTGFKWYTKEYSSSYDKTNSEISKKIDSSELKNSSITNSYTELNSKTSSINQILFLLFFLAAIIFLIFWLVILLRRAILQ